MYSLRNIAWQNGKRICNAKIKFCIGETTNWRFFGIRENSSSNCATIDLDSNVYKRYRIDDCPDFSATLTKKEASCYYRQMQLIRRVEHVSAKLYREKTIRGFCHLYSGQEACCVGQVGAMYEHDCTITAYRCHGWAMQYEISAYQLLAELMGKVTGICRGKGGSMHVYSKNFFGGNGIVGAQVPLGAGIALALKYLKKDAVCLTLYGDGASNQGQVYEAYNMACLWKLPCIFICENNLYAMGTSDKRSACNTEYFTRGDLIPGIWVDGMNLLAVRNATKFARNYALKNGPILMELNTYRYFGHSMSDPDVSYRTRDEIKDVRKVRDPIKMFKKLILDHCLLTEEDVKRIDDETKKEVLDAVAKSRKDKEAGMDDLAGDVYYNNVEPKIRDIRTYTIDHKNFATRYEYKPQPTPKDQIKEPPKHKKPPPKKTTGKSQPPKPGAKPPGKTKPTKK